MRSQRTRPSASPPRSPMTRRPLGSVGRHWPLDDPCELASRGSRGDQGAEEQIEGDSRISSLHFGDSRLARANELGESGLGQVSGLSAQAQALSQCEPELDEFGFLFGESQEPPGRANLPARGLEFPLLRAFHGLPHVFVVMPQSAPAIANHRLGRRGCLLVENLQNQNGVLIYPVGDSPDVVAIPNPKLMETGSDRWHGARVRKTKSLALLKSSEQITSLDARTGGERRLS